MYFSAIVVDGPQAGAWTGKARLKESNQSASGNLCSCRKESGVRSNGEISSRTVPLSASS
jgi:hypothetical protein